MSIESAPTMSERRPRHPALDRPLTMQLAATEYDRVADLLDRLTPAQWATDTECPGWDVRAMAGHMLGMMQMVASVRELARQQLAAARHAKRDGGLMIDALTALQVEQNASLTPAEVVAEVRRLAPKAVRSRRRAPALIRNRTMDDETDGPWTYGYLLDIILTRDPFMHRIDITRATGLTMTTSVEHEGVLVDDVVREWGARHGAPYVLQLSGPAGGRWTSGDGEHHELDALEFCRVVSGRAPGTGLLTTQVPF